jgi:hypothetical protein
MNIAQQNTGIHSVLGASPPVTYPALPFRQERASAEATELVPIGSDAEIPKRARPMFNVKVNVNHRQPCWNLESLASSCG